MKVVLCLFIRLHEKAIDFIEKSRQYLLDRDIIEDIYTADEETILQELESRLENLKQSDRYSRVYKEENTHMDRLLNDIKQDKKLFEELKQKIEKLGLLNQDPKLVALENKIQELISTKRKVVIFTEYIDSAS